MQPCAVAPFAGAWIEIQKQMVSIILSLKSHPSRVRGLKYHQQAIPALSTSVAPFAGAWIEIILYYGLKRRATVAPFAGAWIEISIEIFILL